MSCSANEYRVQLDAYSGPLDLLLHLVKRHEIDLNDIPIAELTKQYLKHLELIQHINVDQAGEFLVMAATLLEIKSQMLWPRQAEEAEGELAASDSIGGPADAESFDPRYELVQQLLAYKRFKDAAIELEHRQLEWSERFPARSNCRRPDYEQAFSNHDAPGEDDAQPLEIDLEDVHALDLGEAFARVLESIGQGQNRDHQITYDDTPIALHAEDIYDRLKREAAEPGQRLTLEQVFEGQRTRSEMIGLFLAMLELVRRRRIRVLQDRSSSVIHLELRPEQDQTTVDDDAVPDWRDPESGIVQYDWPDEAARLRSERRAETRAAWLREGKFEAIDETADRFDLDQIDPDLSGDTEEGSGNPGRS